MYAIRSYYADMDNLDEEADYVILMTMHAAKGLEFPNVFVVGMEENIFPSARSMESESDIEEERRLAYVAITRAKKNLYLSHSVERMLFGTTNRNRPSRFLKELPTEYLEHSQQEILRSNKSTNTNVITAPTNISLQAQLANKKRTEKQSTPSIDFAVGDRVVITSYSIHYTKLYDCCNKATDNSTNSSAHNCRNDFFPSNKLIFCVNNNGRCCNGNKKKKINSLCS